jgi:internalin A
MNPLFFVMACAVCSLGPVTDHDTAKRRIAEWKGKVFGDTEDVLEILLNSTQVEGKDLAILDAFPALTDLSLENTRVGDVGMTHVAKLSKLEWLNLYRTWVGDDGARSLSQSRSIRMLPIGETNLTDVGLAHLSKMSQLTYLGLRGNKITDAGVLHLLKLENLEGLHLGETEVTDKGVRRLSKLSKLEKLWLHDLPITDASIEALFKMEKLRELYLYDTKVTTKGAKRLQVALPKCRIAHEAFTD